MKPQCLLLVLAWVSIPAAFGQVSLPEAVDTAGLAWTSGGDVPWHGLEAVDARSGGDLARCGPMTLEPYLWIPPRTGWMETTVTGPGTFRVFARTNGGAYLSVHLSLNAVEIDTHQPDWTWIEPPAPTAWRALSCAVPSGEHRLRLTACLGCDGQGTIPLREPLVEADEAALLPPAASHGAALDAPGFSWFAGGDVLFATVEDMTHDGIDALHASVPAGSYWLQSEVAGPATISWWRRGRATASVAGLIVTSEHRDEWTLENAFVPPGSHAIRWAEKVTSPVEAWLDQFSSHHESAVSLAEALDAPLRPFMQSAGWQAHTSAAAPDGSDMAWTQVTSEPERIETEVAGPAVVLAHWRVRGFGLDVTGEIDGRAVQYFHGLNFQENTGQPVVIVPPGSHTVSWVATPQAFGPGNALVMLDSVRVVEMGVEALPQKCL